MTLVTLSFLVNSAVFLEAVDPNENPFKMPPDNDIFLLRDKERQRKMQVCAAPAFH